MKILLHICCGSCAIYPIEVLREAGYQVEGFFYNPNIHPFSEYLKRVEAVKTVSEHFKISVHYHHYDFENFLKQTLAVSARSLQHRLCWSLRLKELVKFAKGNGFSYCTTTLFVSPYQDVDLIKNLGLEAAQEAGINFLTADFRQGFRHSHKISKDWNVYRQKYCGCLTSEKESIEQRMVKKRKP